MGSGSDSLYVSNLNYNTSDEELRDAFNGCSSAEVVYDRVSERSKGFGFVRFDSIEQAQAALNDLGGPGSTISINERDARVDFAYPKEQRGGGGGFGAGSGSGSGSGSDSLYVSNLNYSTGNEELKEAFDGCINAEVVYDRSTDRSRGFGFVQFETADLAQAALDDLGGPGATVSIGQRDAKVFPKEQRGGGGRGGRGGGFRGGRGGGYNNQRGQRSGYGQGGY